MAYPMQFIVKEINDNADDHNTSPNYDNIFSRFAVHEK
jgi:hypothetical protein